MQRTINTMKFREYNQHNEDKEGKSIIKTIEFSTKDILRMKPDLKKGIR
jgi:hypothetical protein